MPNGKKKGFDNIDLDSFARPKGTLVFDIAIRKPFLKYWILYYICP
jgi:hypothetical protein